MGSSFWFFEAHLHANLFLGICIAHTIAISLADVAVHTLVPTRGKQVTLELILVGKL